MLAPNAGAAKRPPAGLARRVRDPAPGGLGSELDRLAVALGLDVGEGLGVGLEGDVQLALLHALVQPGAAEDQPPQPVHERALGGADQFGPAVVDVLAQAGRGILDLAVDDQVHQVLGFVVGQLARHEADLARCLLAALAEVALVEGEPKLPVFEHEVVARGVVAAAGHLPKCARPERRAECVVILWRSPPGSRALHATLHRLTAVLSATCLRRMTPTSPTGPPTA